MDTLYTFWDNTTHYQTESVHFLVLMNSATKGFWVYQSLGLGLKMWVGFVPGCVTKASRSSEGPQGSGIEVYGLRFSVSIKS